MVCQACPGALDAGACARETGVLYSGGAVMKTIRWALLSLALFPTACSLTLVPDYARAAFSREHSCPATRITMKKVLVDPVTALVGSSPPADVAADPGRLAVWEENARRDLAEYDNMMAIDLTGCDVHRTYLCWDN